MYVHCMHTCLCVCVPAHVHACDTSRLAVLGKQPELLQKERLSCHSSAYETLTSYSIGTLHFHRKHRSLKQQVEEVPLLSSKSPRVDPSG